MVPMKLSAQIKYLIALSTTLFYEPSAASPSVWLIRNANNCFRSANPIRVPVCEFSKEARHVDCPFSSTHQSRSNYD